MNKNFRSFEEADSRLFWKITLTVVCAVAAAMLALYWLIDFVRWLLCGNAVLRVFNVQSSEQQAQMAV